jgi:hypothetical protein
MARTEPRTPGRRSRRSPGVMLRGRAAGFGHWDDEVNADGGKAKLHRQVRARERVALHRELAQLGY